MTMTTTTTDSYCRRVMISDCSSIVKDDKSIDWCLFRSFRHVQPFSLKTAPPRPQRTQIIWKSNKLSYGRKFWDCYILLALQLVYGGNLPKQISITCSSCLPFWDNAKNFTFVKDNLWIWTSKMSNTLESTFSYARFTPLFYQTFY